MNLFQPLNLLNLGGRSEFRYAATPLDTSTIRLVRILRASRLLQTIALEVQHHPLSTAPPFHALSYSWGPPDRTSPPYGDGDLRTILINKKVFRVLPNLFNALIRLKDLGLAEYYWIDFICINQQDLAERGSQVSIMDQIYQAATQVDIWLGDHNGRSKKLDPLMQRISKAQSTVVRQQLDGSSLDTAKEQRLMESGGVHHRTRPVKLNDPKDHGALEYYDLPPVSEKNWGEFIRVFQASWFRRMWIVQESALARESLVIYGSQTFPWGRILRCGVFLELTELNRSLATAQRGDSSSSSSSFSSRGILADDIIGWEVSRIDLAAALSNGWFEHFDTAKHERRFMEYFSGYTSRTRTAAHFLLLLLWKFRSFECSDPRDKVFALLGILKATPELKGLPEIAIQPSYHAGSTSASVSTLAFVRILEDCQHLGYLALAGKRMSTDVARDREIPSWVRDLRHERGVDVFHGFTGANTSRSPAWDASKYREVGKMGFRVDGPKLHARAYRVGEVVGVSNDIAEDIRGGDAGQASFESVAALVLLSCNQVYKFTRQDRVEVLWRTIVHDRTTRSHPAPDSLGKAFHQWVVNQILAPISRIKGAGARERRHVRIQRLTSLDELARSDATGTIPSLDDIKRCAEGLGLLLAPDEEWPEDSEEFRTAVRNLKDLEAAMEEYAAAATKAAGSRRLFATGSGYFGAAPLSTKVGDEIWIVSTCPQPLVFGPHPTIPNCVELVGGSYVHGIMHGEAIDANTKWEDLCIA